jgi:Holliday junction DNA helicase RuvA
VAGRCWPVGYSDAGMPVSRLRGTVEHAATDTIAIDIGPVALEVAVPARLAADVAVGDAVVLHTHLHVREDALSLFGFATREELALFQQLIGVSGVGPRVALAMLSALEAPELASAIVSGRVDALRKVPGVGQKTAERIVIDLRDKVTPPAEDAVAAAADRAKQGDEAKPDAEVVAALTALGYTQAEAAAAALATPEDGEAPLEERVRRALVSLART